MIVQAGSVNVTTYFKLRNTSNGQATTGATITDIDLQYVRSGVVPVAKVDATALAATDSAHADNKAIEVDGIDQPGLYRVDWPAAAFASGVREVILTAKLASSFVEDIRVELSPAVNVVAVDDDETAATNLKTLYDGVEGFGPAYSGSRGPGVYLNDAAANTNTVNGEDGTWNKPVSTIAAAKIIADSLGIDRIYLVNNSSITLVATMEDYEFVGIGEMSVNIVNFGSQDVDRSVFYNLLLTGAQGGTERCQAKGACLLAITGMEITALACLIADGTSLVLRDDCAFDSCFSAVAGGSAPTLDINSVSNVNVYVRHYSGGFNVANAVATTVMSYEAIGQLTIDATCTSLTIAARGILTYTDNGTTTNLIGDAVVNRTNINTEADLALTDYDPPTRTEATSDKDAIITRGDAAWVTGAGAGAGAISFPYTLTNSTTLLPIADADVWVTLDPNDSQTGVIASGKTDQDGVVTFLLDAGTVYFWRQKTGIDFDNPDTEVVS
jgi:hypothetical protein